MHYTSVRRSSTAKLVQRNLSCMAAFQDPTQGSTGNVPMAARSTMATFITRTSAGQEARLNQLPFLASVNCYTQCNSKTAKEIVQWQPCESAPADYTSMAAWKCVKWHWPHWTGSCTLATPRYGLVHTGSALGQATKYDLASL